MKPNKEKSLAFGRRYLALGILVYIIAVYFALSLSLDFIMGANVKSYAVYSFSVILGIGVVLLCPCLFVRISRKARTYIAGGFLCVLIFTLGFTRTFFFRQSCELRRIELGSYQRLCGMVKSQPKLSGSGKSYGFDLEVHRAYSDDGQAEFGDRRLARIYVPKDTIARAPSYGDFLDCNIRFQMQKKPAFNGAFDFSRYLLQNKIVFAAYCGSADFISPAGVPKSLFSRLEELGLFLRSSIIGSTDISVYKKDERNLLNGILVGATDDFSDELYEDYTRSGLVHITSVSGMHTSYLLIALTVLLGLLKLPRRAVCLTAMPFLVLFSAVSLFTPSVCRAVIMTLVFLFAAVIRRSNDSITSLSIAALILVTINPFTLESYGFLLSFSATLGILIFYDPIFAYTKRLIIKNPGKPFSKPDMSTKIRSIPYKLNRFAVSSVCISLAAMIGLGFFMARFFGRLQWGSILVNIAVFPLVAVIFIAGYINWPVFLIFKPLSEIISRFIINPCLVACNALARFFSRDIFSFDTIIPDRSFFVVYVAVCALLYMLLSPPRSDLRDNGE